MSTRAVGTTDLTQQNFVMAGHSCSKNGVASLAYVPAIHVFMVENLIGKADEKIPLSPVIARSFSDEAIQFLLCGFWIASLRSQ